MKLTDKISWLMVRVQRSLFPHLNQCLPTPLTEQEERLVSILEIIQATASSAAIFAIGNPVAFEAKALERDTRGFISIRT